MAGTQAFSQVGGSARVRTSLVGACFQAAAVIVTEAQNKTGTSCNFRCNFDSNIFK
eukprot:gene4872-6892_t